MSQTEKKATSAKEDATKATNELNLFTMSDEAAQEALADMKSNKNLGFTKLGLSPNKTDRTIKVRLLPNIWGGTSNHNVRLYSSLESFWIKLNTEDDGVYHSQKRVTGKCPLTRMYWKLKKSNNPLEVERAELIAPNMKFYAYAFIESDSDNLLDGVHIIQFGHQIREKIDKKMEGSLGDKVNVFNPSKGATLNIVIDKPKGKKYAQFSNSFWSNDNTSIDFAKYPQADIQKAINELKNLDEFTEKEWNIDESNAVYRIIDYIVSGKSKQISKSDSVELPEDDDDKDKFDMDDTTKFFNTQQ
jgi:hypothetical protein